jgi:hypothetical protein
MLLSRKWAASMGGNIQMDWSYVNILVGDGFVIRLDCEQQLLHDVDDPRQQAN